MFISLICEGFEATEHHAGPHPQAVQSMVAEVSKDSSSIKVIDFGLAELFEPEQKANDSHQQWLS